jgi:hypothetical protein
MSLQLLAKQMEAKGRGGDSVLVHMTPDEVAGLQKLAESAGGTLSVNPETGLVEANFLKRLLPTLAGIGVGMFAGPMAGAAAGALVGGMTAPKEQRNMGILMGALGGYGGAGIGAGLTSAGAGAAQNAAMSAIPQGATTAAHTAAQNAAMQGLSGAAANNAAAEASKTLMAQGFATDQGIQNLAAAEASKNFMAQPVYTQLGQGVSALGKEAGRDAFMQGMGGASGLAKTAGMAAAPMMMAEEQKQAEAPTDDERYVYDFDYGRTGADSTPVASSRERTYFQPTYRRVFSAAEGGEVADAAPVDAGIAGGMSGASKAAYDYLMGNATSSAPQGIAAPAMMASTAEPAQVEARSDRMYSFNPATGAFTKNPNYVDPAAAPKFPGVLGGIMGGDGGGGDYSFSRSPDVVGGGYEGSINSSMSQNEMTSAQEAGMGEGLSSGYDKAAGGLLSLAKGGMKSGGFVIPADVVSMVGEGNTDAGYKRIKSMVPGATAIKGKDGGQADTVKTSIEGKQPARVAHGEMYIPPETVKRMGGAKKLYAMMDRVRQQATGSKKQIRPVSLKKAMA